jgi:hypothetical protein
MPERDTERDRDKNLDVQDPVPGFTAFRRDEIWHFFSLSAARSLARSFQVWRNLKICVARRIASRIVSDTMTACAMVTPAV